MRKNVRAADESTRETCRPKAFTPAVDLREYARDAEQLLEAVKENSKVQPLSEVRMARARPSVPEVEIEVEVEIDVDDPEAAYWAVLGAPSAVPQLAISIGDLREKSLDPSAGFIVSQLDGVSTVEDILDVCGLPRRDVLRILFEFAQTGIITF